MRLGNRIGFVSITRSIAWEIVFVIEMQEAKEVSVLPSVLFDVVVTWKTNDRPSRFPNFENEDGGGGEEVEEEEEDGRSAFRTRDPSLCHATPHTTFILLPHCTPTHLIIIIIIILLLLLIIIILRRTLGSLACLESLGTGDLENDRLSTWQRITTMFTCSTHPYVYFSSVSMIFR